MPTEPLGTAAAAASPAPALALNIDGSAHDLPLHSLDLSRWQEAVRFGCTLRTWRAFAAALHRALPARHGTLLLGSGDFHHITHLLIERQAREQPVEVAVCDNHPDNMRFPFGIHCGSWVHHAARLHNVARIHVVGITSADAGTGRAWENHLLPLWRDKVRYWTCGPDTRWAAALGLKRQVLAFSDRGSLVHGFTAHLRECRAPIYLSIDKDVLAPEVVRTNWDQGQLNLEDLAAIIAATRGRLVGSDITGEVSSHRYRSRWKRWLTSLDRQQPPPPAMLRSWQAQQGQVNRQLLAWLETARARMDD